MSKIKVLAIVTCVLLAICSLALYGLGQHNGWWGGALGNTQTGKVSTVTPGEGENAYYGIVVREQEGKATVETESREEETYLVTVISDYALSESNEFMVEHGEELRTLIENGHEGKPVLVQFVIAPLNASQGASEADYASQMTVQASIMSRVIAAKAPEQWLGFHEELSLALAQYKEDSSWGEDKVRAIMDKAGIPHDVADLAITATGDKRWLTHVSQAAMVYAEVHTTPVVYVGKELVPPEKIKDGPASWL